MPAKRIHDPVTLDGTQGFGAVRNGPYSECARLQPGVLGPAGSLRRPAGNDQSAVNGLHPLQFSYRLIDKTLWRQVSGNLALLHYDVPFSRQIERSGGLFRSEKGYHRLSFFCVLDLLFLSNGHFIKDFQNNR
jgi:hypothetical protein